MLAHCDRKSHEVIFKKCVRPRCNHCTSSPVIATNAWSYLKEREFKWANPVESVSNPEHYKTFIEMEDVEVENMLTGNCIITVLRKRIINTHKKILVFSFSLMNDHFFYFFF